MADLFTTADLATMDARLFMVTDGRWKLIHAEGFRPMLYDMERDPEEFHDLGGEAVDPHDAGLR